MTGNVRGWKDTEQEKRKRATNPNQCEGSDREGF